MPKWRMFYLKATRKRGIISNYCAMYWFQKNKNLFFQCIMWFSPPKKGPPVMREICYNFHDKRATRWSGRQIASRRLHLRCGRQNRERQVEEITRKLGIGEATFCRWKKKYIGLKITEMRRLKQLEKENQKLKRLVADLSLDKLMLQDILWKKSLLDIQLLAIAPHIDQLYILIMAIMGQISMWWD